MSSNPIDDMNTLLGQIITGQALALRVLADMIEECRLPHPHGGVLTRRMIAQRLALATDLIGKMEVQGVAGMGRYDTAALRAILDVLTQEAPSGQAN